VKSKRAGWGERNAPQAKRGGAGQDARGGNIAKAEAEAENAAQMEKTRTVAEKPKKDLKGRKREQATGKGSKSEETRRIRVGTHEGEKGERSSRPPPPGGGEREREKGRNRADKRGTEGGNAVKSQGKTRGPGAQ